MDHNQISERMKKRAIWDAHINAQRSSGMTRIGYCQKHGLSLESFNYNSNRRKLALPIQKSDFITVPITEKDEELIQITLQNGIIIHFPVLGCTKRLAEITRHLQG